MTRLRLAILAAVLGAMLLAAPAALASLAVNSIGATAGTAVSPNTEIATFTDGTDLVVLPCPGASSLNATVNWGDGSAPAAATVSGPVSPVLLQPCRYDVTAGHLYTAAGTYTFGVAVSGDVGSATGTATVADVTPAAGGAITFQATAGVAASGAVANFSDGNIYAGANTYAAMITWGDGSNSPGTVTATSPGQFVVDGTHEYTAVGTYATSVTVTDQAGSTITVPGTADVVAPGTTTTGTGTTTTGPGTTPPPKPATLHSVETVPVTATAGGQFDDLLAVFTDSEGGTSSGSYLITIAWGDGASTAGAAVPSSTAGQFGVTGGHIYTAAGSYSIVITVLAPNGSTLRVDTTATVTAGPATTFALKLTRAALRHGRELTVSVGCPGSETTCRGTLTAYQVAGARNVMLASTLFILPGGRSGLLDLMLSPRRLRQIAHSRHVRLQLIAHASDPSTHRNGQASAKLRGVVPR